MPELKGSKTHDNLKEAFAGESQANRRYLYFAQKADVEGYPDVAALFRSVAEGETGHAFGHFDFLAEVGDPVTGVAGRRDRPTTSSRRSPARPTSTPRCTRASPRPPATRASRRSPSGSRRSPGPRRATPAASRRASRTCQLTLDPDRASCGPRPRVCTRRPRASPGLSRRSDSMRKLTVDDIVDMRAYERERDEFRRQIIDLKQMRRDRARRPS